MYFETPFGFKENILFSRRGIWFSRQVKDEYALSDAFKLKALFVLQIFENLYFVA